MRTTASARALVTALALLVLTGTACESLLPPPPDSAYVDGRRSRRKNKTTTTTQQSTTTTTTQPPASSPPAEPTTTQPPTTTTQPPATTTTSPPSTTQPPTTTTQLPAPTNPYPDPGSVGVLTPGSLTVVQPAGGKLTISGGDAVLQNTYLKGGVLYTGSGTLTIRNSIVEAGYGWTSQVQSYGGALLIEDTTIRGVASYVPDSLGAIYSTGPVTARRNDISGGVDGLKVGSNSLVERNWIHDLRPGTSGHIDGIQISDQSNVTVRNNRFEPHTLANFDPAQHNAAVWIAPWTTGGRASNITVEGNYLVGGYYAFKAHSGLASGVVITGIAVRNNTFGPYPSGGGYSRIEGPSTTITEWSGNVTHTGQPIPTYYRI